MGQGNRNSFYRKNRRSKILRKSGGVCAYCGLPLTRATMTIDHVVPRSKGGAGMHDNLLAACYPCNMEKGDGSVMRFRPYRPPQSGSPVTEGA